MSVAAQCLCSHVSQLPSSYLFFPSRAGDKFFRGLRNATGEPMPIALPTKAQALKQDESNQHPQLTHL
eukprot:6487496-Amphidinium_carterae.1